MCPVWSPFLFVTCCRHAVVTTDDAASPKQSEKMCGSVHLHASIPMQESRNLGWRQEVLISTINVSKFSFSFDSKDTGHLSK